jgi:MscS family membrane protein
MTYCGRKWILRRILIGLAALGILFSVALAGAQEPTGETAPPLENRPGGELSLPAVRTDSPRQTLASFIRLRDALEAALSAYWAESTFDRGSRVNVLMDQLRMLSDLSQVPVASRREVGGDTVAYLLDIFGRIGLPGLDSVPDLSASETGELTHYAIPDTPFRIVRIQEGARTGEFLFSDGTVQAAPWFYRGIENLPLQATVPIDSWIEQTRQLTGPMMPPRLVAAVPKPLRQPVLGTPVWKILIVLLLTAPACLLVILVYRLIARRKPGDRLSKRWLSLLGPLAVILITWALQTFFTDQVNVAGRFSRVLDVAVTLVVFMALAWAFWLAAIALFESIVRHSDFPQENIDANMLRLVARMIGAIGGIVFLGTGMQALGLPVTSVLAGLGIGGLAVALAIRPTLENLIGGFILYLDKPIRVGDFCGFGVQSGTIERIGVRSTQIRALDRTLISVPNAQFADMQIINWAECDQMLIQQVIGLRHETDGDQLRYVLAKIREMFHAHPRIDSETVRVRFDGYGPSSLDVAIRVYARTREWNDYFAIREDVLFRIKEIIVKAGTAVAVSSQSFYLGRDRGIDANLAEKARQEVASWRKANRLPFPRFPTDMLERLAGRLRYPPRGSPDFHASEEELAEARDERLSAEPLARESRPAPEPQNVAEDGPKPEVEGLRR